MPEKFPDGSNENLDLPAADTHELTVRYQRDDPRDPEAIAELQAQRELNPVTPHMPTEDELAAFERINWRRQRDDPDLTFEEFFGFPDPREQPLPEVPDAPPVQGDDTEPR